MGLNFDLFYFKYFIPDTALVTAWNTHRNFICCFTLLTHTSNLMCSHLDSTYFLGAFGDLILFRHLVFLNPLKLTLTVTFMTICDLFKTKSNQLKM